MKKSLGAKTLVYPTPVWCVGTYDDQGKANVMTVAWGGICCSVPPCVTVSLRKATYTYGCIMTRKAYTLSVPDVQHAKEADYFGMVSGRDTDKFSETGLTPVRSGLVDAPYVGEFPMVLECKLIHHYEIGLHTHFVGEILDVKVDESVLGGDGKPDIAKVSPLVFAPEVRRYYGVGDCVGQAFEIGKSRGDGGAESRHLAPGSLDKGKALADGKFTCLGCGGDTNAKTGDYCPQCRAFVCRECRKYVLGHDDKAKPSVPVCPLCRTALIAGDE